MLPLPNLYIVLNFFGSVKNQHIVTGSAGIAIGIASFFYLAQPVDKAPSQLDALREQHTSTMSELRELRVERDLLALDKSSLEERVVELRDSAKKVRTERDTAIASRDKIIEELTLYKTNANARITDLTGKLCESREKNEEYQRTLQASESDLAELKKNYEIALGTIEDLSKKEQQLTDANDWILATKEYQAREIYPVYEAGLKVTEQFMDYIRELRKHEVSSLDGLDFKYEKTVGKATRERIAVYDEELRDLQRKRDYFAEKMTHIASPQDE